MSIDLHEIYSQLITTLQAPALYETKLSYTNSLLTIEDDHYDLSHFRNCYIAASGKAAQPMAERLLELLKSHIKKGVVITPDYVESSNILNYYQSTHPYPSEKSIVAAQAMVELFEDAGDEDLIIYLLSGGSSALMELPLESLSLESIRSSTKTLLNGGYDITQVNCLRKALSQVKGGKLAKATQAKVIAIVISDVVGDDFATIGSGPLFTHSSSCLDALLNDNYLLQHLPKEVVSSLQHSPQNSVEKSIKHYLLASNEDAKLQSAKLFVNTEFEVLIEPKPIEGAIEACVETFVEHFRSLPSKTVLIAGGESSVSVTGDGKGGRNQHFALLALAMLKSECSYSLMAAGTDGIDGNSDAAGAIISDTLYQQSDLSDIQNALETFNSNTFFAAHNALINSGYTHTNVSDIVIAIKY